MLRDDPPVGRELTVYARAAWMPLAAQFVERMRERQWENAPLDATVIG